MPITIFFPGHFELLLVLIGHLQLVLELVLVVVLAFLEVLLLLEPQVILAHFLLNLIFFLVGAQEIAIAQFVTFLAEVILALLFLLLLLLHLKVMFVGCELLLHEHLLGKLSLAATTRLVVMVLFHLHSPDLYFNLVGL